MLNIFFIAHPIFGVSSYSGLRETEFCTAEGNAEESHDLDENVLEALKVLKMVC